MTHPFRSLAAVVAALWITGGVASAAPATPPNVVMIFIDDMGWGDFSCFGNTQATTPHIDRLAAEGIRYSQFYVNSPICSPSRVALTTGQYPLRWGITSYLSNRAENRRRGVADWLDPKAPTLARLLKGAGYTTGHFGKWHMGGQRDVGEAPLIQEYGFDESLTNFEGLGARLLPLADSHDGKPLRRHSLGSDNLGRGPIIWYDRAQVTAGFAGAAIAFIKKAATDQRPFYVNLWPDDVHSPYYPPPGRRGDGSKRTLYHAVLETMDTQLGALFDHIREDPQLRENTLVLICSDNGPEPGAGSAGPFRGFKTQLYEGGVRSSLIAWAPGLMPAARAGSHDESSVFSAIDLVPSLLAIAGVPAPAGISFDGENVSGALIGQGPVSRKAPLFWIRPPDRKSQPSMGLGIQRDLAMREGDWKFLCDFDGSKPELYDLAQDRAETSNLAERHPEKVTAHRARLLEWYARTKP